MDKRRNKTHICMICRKCGVTQIHHVFGGAYRKKSEKMDLVIEVCPNCHREIHDNPKKFEWIKKKLQKQWEEQHSHDEWMNIFKRNWL